MQEWGISTMSVNTDQGIFFRTSLSRSTAIDETYTANPSDAETGWCGILSQFP
jgi:hypothetical protein